jgi:uncharacterized RDD family membrane protein YckC
MKPAGFWIRVLAALIDAVLVTIFQAVLGFVMGIMGLTKDLSEEQRAMLEKIAKESGDPSQVLGATAQMFVQSGAVMSVFTSSVVVLAIVIWFIHKRGGTPGKLALGLRIQMANDGSNVPVWRCFMREFIGKYFFWAITLGIGLLAVAFNKRKRGIHDVIAGTVVVKTQDI